MSLGKAHAMLLGRFAREPVQSHARFIETLSIPEK
jgi:hypothetical protein